MLWDIKGLYGEILKNLIYILLTAVFLSVLMTPIRGCKQERVPLKKTVEEGVRQRIIVEALDKQEAIARQSK